MQEAGLFRSPTGLYFPWSTSPKVVTFIVDRPTMSGSPWAKEWKSLASDNSQKAILLPTFYKTFDTWPTDISQEIIKKNSSPVAIRVDDQRSRADCPRPRPASGRCRCWANTIRHGDVIAMVAGCAYVTVVASRKNMASTPSFTDPHDATIVMKNRR
jgi:hypothetical protein